MRRMMLFVLAIMAAVVTAGLTVATSCSAWSAETNPAQTPPLAGGKGSIDLKSQKVFMTEALKGNDVWTALQIDAYAVQKLGAKPTAILGASEVIGDPLFAFPYAVTGVFDRGGFVGVVSGQMYFHLAPDGRPLALAMPLGISGYFSAMSLDGRFLAVAERRRMPTAGIHFTVRAVPTGAEMMASVMPIAVGDYIDGGLQVAEDGSAAVTSVFDSSDLNPRLFIASGPKRTAVVPGFWRPHGIGPAAAWVLAEPWAARGADSRVYAVLHGGKVSPMISVAAGPGIAAAIGLVPVPAPTEAPAPAPASPPARAPVVRAPAAKPGLATDPADVPAPPPEPEYKAHIVKNDGAIVELPVSMRLSKSARVHSVGGWLLVGSGYGAQQQEEVDLIGRVIKGGGQRQPFTTALYRWKDLLADPETATPVQVYVSEAKIADTEVAAVYVMRDKQVLFVDLAGGEPVERPFVTLTEEVDGFSVSHQRVCFDMVDGTLKVFDPKGVELWSGQAARHELFDPQWMVVANGDSAATRTYTAVRLDADPAVRSQAKLQIPLGSWEVEIDRFGRRVMASTTAKWIELDPVTGKALRQGASAKGRPYIHTRRDQIGRFQALEGRVSLKGTPVLDDSGQHWVPRDAWQVGPSMILLDRTGRVVVSGKKRGTYQTLGLCEDGHHFGAVKDSLVIANDDNQVLAAFTSGPVLNSDPDTKLQIAEPLPVGPWRLTTNNVSYATIYNIPRGAALVWDAAKCGFAPQVLRSPPTHPGMLALTASLIFDLDPATAKLMGSPERPAP